MADLNSDSNLDVVISDFSDGVSVLFGTPNGGFGASVFLITDTSDTGYRPEVGVFDIDGDSDLDLVTLDGIGDKVDLSLNNGDGTFEIELSCPLGNSPNSIPIADFDGDVFWMVQFHTRQPILNYSISIVVQFCSAM